MPPWMSTLIAVLTSVIASSGFWTIVQYKLQKNDKTAEKLEELTQSIKNLDEKVDKNDAKVSRSRILRFADELQDDRHHTLDHFKSIKEDIDNYEMYCDRHPDFKNGFAKSSIRFINRTYDELLEKHEFRHDEED